jgi:PPOX class probable F420-dependent enzyme
MAVAKADLDVLKQFLSETNRAILMTHRTDGGIQSSPMSVIADDAGNVLLATRGSTAKVRNLLRDPRATVCLITEKFLGAWMQAEGTAEVARLPEALPALAEFYRRRTGEDTSTDAWRERVTSEDRVLITIRTSKVTLAPILRQR